MVNAGAALTSLHAKGTLMDNDLYTRCLAVVRELDAEHGWGLSAAAHQQYSQALSSFVPHDCPELRLRFIVQNYHNDHTLLRYLGDRSQPKHHQAWEKLTKDIGHILQKANLTWSSDQAKSREDLVQIACAAVLEALPTFRFESKFTTWLTTVAVRSIQRVFRDGSAKKRAVRPDSLDGIDESAVLEDSRFDEQVSGDLLLEKIAEILRQHPNPLLLKVFLLKSQHDRGTKEIGELLNYHPSRIRALLAEAKRLLQHDPAIQTWNKDHPDDQDTENV